MARFTIYSSSGVAKAEGTPTYTGTYMKPGLLEFREIASPTPIAWAVGDYVDYSRTGLRYTLYRIPQLKKQARNSRYGAAFVYSGVQFYDESYKTEICPFRDLVLGSNRIHFSTQPSISVFDDVAGIAERFQACLVDLYGTGSWVVRVVGETEYYDAMIAKGMEPAAATSAATDWLGIISEEKEFVVSGVTIAGGLEKVNELWNDIGWVYRVENGVNTIVIGGGGLAASSPLYAYGKGNGLESLTRTVANADELANRLYVYGSTRNMPSRWYPTHYSIKDGASVDIQHLMLPVGAVQGTGYNGWGTTEVDGVTKPDAAKAYIQSANPGLIRPKSVYFDGTGNLGEIYPTIKGITISDLWDVMPSGATYRPSGVYSGDERIDQIISAVNPTDTGFSASSTTNYLQNNYLSVSENRSGSLPAQSDDNIVLFSIPVAIASGGTLDLNLLLSQIGGSYSGAFSYSRPYLYVKTLTATLGVSSIQHEEISENTWTYSCRDLNLSSVVLSTGQVVTIEGVIEASNDTDVAISYTLSASGEAQFRAMFNREQTFLVNVRQVGFNISSQGDLGSGKTIAMTSGACAGRSFAIKNAVYNSLSDTWSLALIRSRDDSLNQWFPNSTYPLAAGNTFVLLDIALPEVYVSIAERRLLAAAQDLLAYTEKEVWQYNPEINAKFMVDNSRTIVPGEYIGLQDPDIDLGSDENLSYLVEHGENKYYTTVTGQKILLEGSGYYALVLVDSVTISEGDAEIPTYKLTLRDRKKKKYTEYESPSEISSTPVTVSDTVADNPTEEEGGGVKLSFDAEMGMLVLGSGTNELSVFLDNDHEIPLKNRIVHNDGLLSPIKTIAVVSEYPDPDDEDPNTLYLLTG